MSTVKFETKKIGDLWYCYGTLFGYDYSFCSDNEDDAIAIAKYRISKILLKEYAIFPDQFWQVDVKWNTNENTQ